MRDRLLALKNARRGERLYAWLHNHGLATPLIIMGTLGFNALMRWANPSLNRWVSLTIAIGVMILCNHLFKRDVARRNSLIFVAGESYKKWHTRLLEKGYTGKRDLATNFLAAELGKKINEYHFFKGSRWLRITVEDDTLEEYEKDFLQAHPIS